MHPFLRRAVLACCLLTATGLAQADWRQALPEARLVGSADYSFFGFRLYSARLWSPTAPLAVDAPFALELTYHRTIERDDLVAASLKEIRRTAGDRVSEAQLQAWAEQMRQAFVDVEPGQRITGVFLPGQGARFYFGDQLTHAVDDRAFARAFFDIWLSPRTREPERREELLGLASN